jgi:UPF0716 protein FxsA
MLGCFGALLLLAWLALEGITLWWVGGLLNKAFEAQIGGSGPLLLVAWLVLAVVIGIRFARWHLQRIMAGILSGQAGRHVIGVIGAVLLAIPGLLTDVIGILLLIPAVQTGLSALGGKALAAVVKQSLGRMGGMTGGANPFAGFSGNPFGAPAGGTRSRGPVFPGMKPLTPDDRAAFPRSGKSAPKTYDTTVERD